VWRGHLITRLQALEPLEFIALAERLS